MMSKPVFLVSSVYCDGTIRSLASTASSAKIGGAMMRTPARRKSRSSSSGMRGSGGLTVGSMSSR